MATRNSRSKSRGQSGPRQICAHPMTIAHPLAHSNCLTCGVFISNEGDSGVLPPFAGELGKWNCSTLQLFQNMQEEEQLAHFQAKPNKRATFLTTRKELVQTINDLGERLGLAPLTQSHAVRYLDHVLSQVEFPKTRLKLVAICCSLIASKFDELDEKIPLIRDYLRASKYAYNFNAVEECESFLLSILKWNLKITTPRHFYLIMMRQGLLFETDQILSEERHIETLLEQGSETPSTCRSNASPLYLPVLSSELEKGGELNKLVKRIPRYAEYLLGLSAQDYILSYETRSSLLAATCVLAARMCNKVKPVWNQNLQLITGYSEQDMGACLKRMKSLFGEVFKFPENEKREQIQKIKALQHRRIHSYCPETTQFSDFKLKVQPVTLSNVETGSYTTTTIESHPLTPKSESEHLLDIKEKPTDEICALLSSDLLNKMVRSQAKEQRDIKKEGEAKQLQQVKEENRNKENKKVLQGFKKKRVTGKQEKGKALHEGGALTEGGESDFENSCPVKGAITWNPIIKLHPIPSNEAVPNKLKLALR